MPRLCVMLVAACCVLGNTVASPMLFLEDNAVYMTTSQGIEIESVIGHWLTYHGPSGLYRKTIIKLSKIKYNELINYKRRLLFSPANTADVDWRKVSLYGQVNASIGTSEFLVENLDDSSIRLIPIDDSIIESNIFTVELVKEKLTIRNCSSGIEIDLFKFNPDEDMTISCRSFHDAPLLDFSEMFVSEKKDGFAAANKTVEERIYDKTETEDKWIKVSVHIENRTDGITYEKDFTIDDVGKLGPAQLVPIQSALEYLNISFVPVKREPKANITDPHEELYNYITDGRYDEAVYLSNVLENSKKGAVIAESVRRLLNGGVRNIMGYAYKLWAEGTKQIVIDYFPESFKLIFNESDLRIINEKYSLPLKLDSTLDYYRDRLVWGDGDRSNCRSDSFKWKLIPVWSNGEIFFQILNLRHNMYLKLDVNHVGIGDRLAWGARKTDENRFNWALEPVRVGGNIVFFVINRQYNQGLKLDIDADRAADRKLWGHNGYVYADPQRFVWSIKPWA